MSLILNYFILTVKHQREFLRGENVLQNKHYSDSDSTTKRKTKPNYLHIEIKVAKLTKIKYFVLLKRITLKKNIVLTLFKPLPEPR